MMIEARLVFALLLVHWIGDFLLQFNVIAQRKGASLRWLGAHVMLYTIVLFLACLFFADWQLAGRFAMLNGVAHFLVDLGTSRLTNRWKQDVRRFYLTVGFDQFLHTATLVISATLLL